MSKGKVLVAMSGGIDSSVAAILLHRQGYEPVGITMKTWDYALGGGNPKETGCCNLDTINDARAVAVKLGFPHYTIDLKEEFNCHIISNFISEYMSGHTPNPCVLCNSFIKWKALLKKADALGCNYIATGHYARINCENGRYYLKCGKDDTKDQTYVLWQLSQQDLARTLFPLGEFTKSEVRQMAIDWHFNKLAKKKESYEICFIPDNDYRSFLRLQVPDLEKKVGEGFFVDTSGKVLGRHKGYPFYTIGQRKGLEVAAGYPLYVKDIDVEANRITLGRKEDLLEKKMLVTHLNLMKYTVIPERGLKALVKIRYKDKGTPAWLLPKKDDTLTVLFDKEVSAITPGQSAVFYEGCDVIGGGIIKKIL